MGYTNGISRDWENCCWVRDDFDCTRYHDGGMKTNRYTPPENLPTPVKPQDAEIKRLRGALDIAGWDAWFLSLQLAVRGNESLINECGERIERARKIVEAAKGE